MKFIFAIILASTVMSIACSASRSASSPTVPNNNAVVTQVSPQYESAPTQDKPKCSLTLASAPPVNGLKLGMTTDEVLALFPGSKDDAEVKSNLAPPPIKLGASSFVIRPAKFESSEKFAGIGQITFTFLDARMSDLTVGYDGPEYSHVDKFVTKFVEGTSLPPAEEWEVYVGLDNQLKTLTCSDFEVRVFAGGPGGNLNYVSMRDLEADKKLKDRRKKAREKASPGQRVTTQIPSKNFQGFMPRRARGASAENFKLGPTTAQEDFLT